VPSILGHICVWFGDKMPQLVWSVCSVSGTGQVSQGNSASCAE